MSRARAPTASVLPQSETWTRLLARSCSAPTVGDQSLTPAERWSRKARPPRGRAASQQFYSCPSSRGAKSRPAETLDEFRGGSFGPGAKTEHLRVFIANEHKERLPAVAPIVVVPEDGSAWWSTRSMAGQDDDPGCHRQSELANALAPDRATAKARALTYLCSPSAQRRATSGLLQMPSRCECRSGRRRLRSVPARTQNVRTSRAPRAGTSKRLAVDPSMRLGAARREYRHERRARAPGRANGGARRRVAGESPESAWQRRCSGGPYGFGGRPRLGIGPACRGIRPASLRARRSTISTWALRLRKSSLAHRARASWTAGSMRSSTCLRSRLTNRACRC
jgi:hypothetical protein